MVNIAILIHIEIFWQILAIGPFLIIIYDDDVCKKYAASGGLHSIGVAVNNNKYVGNTTNKQT